MYTSRLVIVPFWKNPSADRIPSLVLVSMSGLQSANQGSRHLIVLTHIQTATFIG